MRGIKTSSPLYFVFNMINSITLFNNIFITHRVPLQSWGWLIFRNIITTDSTFKNSGG